MSATLKGQMPYGSGYGFNSASRHALVVHRQTRIPDNKPNIWIDWFFGGVPSFNTYNLALSDAIGKRSSDMVGNIRG